MPSYYFDAKLPHTHVVLNPLILQIQLLLDGRFYPFHDGGRYHIETSPFICGANQLTGLYDNGLRHERVKANLKFWLQKLKKECSLFGFFHLFSTIYWTKHVKSTLKSCLVSGFPFDYRCKTFTKLSNFSMFISFFIFL